MDRNTRIVVGWCLNILCVAAVLVVIFTGCGLFAKTQGYYVEAQGISHDKNNKPFGHVYVVMEDRRPGPDRHLATFQDPVSAWTYMHNYDKQPLPPYLHNAGRP